MLLLMDDPQNNVDLDVLAEECRAFARRHLKDYPDKDLSIYKQWDLPPRLNNNPRPPPDFSGFLQLDNYGIAETDSIG